MRQYANVITAYAIMIALIILVGIFQSWNVALAILNFCLISAVMTMGANIQWGYAGLINFGIMGYTALGGLAAVLVSVPPVREAWQVGGLNMILCLGIIVLIVFAVRYVLKNFPKSNKRNIGIGSIILVGLIILRLVSEPAIESIEAVSPATTGFLGGLGLPIVFSWIVGAFFAAGLAYIIGKVALGLIIKQPVFLSLTIEFNNLPNSFEVKSSKLLAIVNRVKGLYSRAVTLNLLKGKINLSRISSSIFILIILFDFSCSDVSNPFIFFIDKNYLIKIKR